MDYNTGNIVINEYFKKTIKFNEAENIEDANKIVLLCNNIIRPGILKKNQNLTKMNISDINKTGKSVVAVGLGAQATLENLVPKEYIKTLEPELIKWLYDISENSETLGVRGEFTADVMSAMGINNVEIVGCPTWFVNGNNQCEIVKKDWNKGLKPACYTCWEAWSKWHAEWNNKIISEIMDFDEPKYVIQSEFDCVPYMFYNDNPRLIVDSSFRTILASSVDYVSKLYNFDKNDLFLNPKLKKLFKFFLKTSDWEDFIRTRDFSYGMRIHGSIVSIKQGVPAMTIAPDSRILELSELFKIPCLRVNKVSSNDFSLRKFYEDADYSEMNKAYPILLKNYNSFLKRNGLTPNL